MAFNHGVYHPKDTLRNTMKMTALTTVAGLSIAAVRNTLQRANYGPMGVFTQYGGTIGMLAAMGFSFQFFKDATANLRAKDDAWNDAVGGFFGGSMCGIWRRTLPAVLKYGAGLSLLMGVFNYTGGSLGGRSTDPTVDEFERKQFLRKNKRIPMEQTIEELGEGRGIYAPGYEERRRQRIKENYGIDVRAPPAH
ncbi:hypothetical protein K490DRAFT_46727 [Saccharata proteae CBS 121410]|uniref:NADH-ubiquinone oxidoreductase 213 kDa subunit n=1 Tax=Saccharata proteae CBS 121410 TaxID=1314787 RepID=A0A9P4LXT7_9PEZI|nr:hypothetical protein K490DRAFT_46727 [Saccharata proteae CBS 121410]